MNKKIIICDGRKRKYKVPFSSFVLLICQDNKYNPSGIGWQTDKEGYIRFFNQKLQYVKPSSRVKLLFIKNK